MIIEGVLTREFAAIIDSEINLSKGDLLYHIGDKFNYFYAIKSGAFKASTITEDGREQISSFYYSGELIGFDAVHSGRYRSNLEALDASTLCRISYDKLLELSSLTPEFQSYIIRLMSQRICFNSSIRPNSQAKEKIGSFIIDFISRVSRNVFCGDSKFIFPMGRFDIGSFLGLTPETVTRTLGSLKRDKVLTCSAKTLVIHDMNALKELSCLPVMV
jgi:CRP/FNR family transcriptional regulator, anaerobic regulatory protein